MTQPYHWHQKYPTQTSEKKMQETLCSGDGHWIPECEQLLPDFRKCLSQLIYFDVHYETLLGLNNTQIQDSFTSTGRVLKMKLDMFLRQNILQLTPQVCTYSCRICGQRKLL